MLTLTTKLEAINTMLSCIGEAPVNTLATTDLEQVASATATLDEVSREVQALGWHYNTEYDYPLALASGGALVVPQNTLAVTSSSQYRAYDIVQRGTTLYNRKLHTAVFDKAIWVDIIFGMEWEELPQAFRHLIMIRAARRFQARELGSETLHKFSERDESLAMAAVTTANAESEKANMFTDSISTSFIFQNRPC